MGVGGSTRRRTRGCTWWTPRPKRRRRCTLSHAVPAWRRDSAWRGAVLPTVRGCHAHARLEARRCDRRGCEIDGISGAVCHGVAELLRWLLLLVVRGLRSGAMCWGHRHREGGARARRLRGRPGGAMLDHVPWIEAHHGGSMERSGAGAGGRQAGRTADVAECAPHSSRVDAARSRASSGAPNAAARQRWRRLAACKQI